MRRQLMIVAAMGISTLVSMPAFAQEYQEALPDDASVQKVVKKMAAAQPIAHPVKPAKDRQSAASVDSQMAVLMSKVLQLNKDVGVYQQNTMQRIDTLKQNEQQLQQNIQKLQQLMQMFDKQVQALQVQQGHLSQAHQDSSSGGWFANMAQSPGMLGLYAGVAAVLSLLLLLLWRTKPRQRVVEPEAEQQEEYDFMSTSEAIPAKLDLARAYMAMEDFDSARGVVAEVFAKGSQLHKQQAQALLDEMASSQQGGDAHGA